MKAFRIYRTNLLDKDIQNHTKHGIIGDTSHHKHYAKAFQNQDIKRRNQVLGLKITW